MAQIIDLDINANKGFGLENVIHFKFNIGALIQHLLLNRKK